MVFGEINRDLTAELERSVVANALHPVDIELVGAKLKDTFPSIESIREIDTYKMLITFKSVKEREEVLEEGDDLLTKYFDEVRVWSLEETR